MNGPLLFGVRGVESRARFFRRVHALAARLPEVPCCLNLCEGRDSFMLAFAAAMTRGVTTLLPQGRDASALSGVLREHPLAFYFAEQALPGLDCPWVSPVDSPSSAGVPDGQTRDASHWQEPPSETIVARVFTSGSTGSPMAHDKRWGSLREGARLTREALQLQGHTLVATVPPQHMFGLELSIIQPLCGGVAVHRGRPFYPEDVQQALAEVPAPRVLVTTPYHLKILLASGLSFPPLSCVVTATAPLPEGLACEAEAYFAAPLQEIYGSTETGAIACRGPVRDTRWHAWPGLRLNALEEGTGVAGAHLEGEVRLPDRIQWQDEGCFHWLGRSSDMLKLAGRRASLAELNRQLLGIDGVDDGVIFLPDEGLAARPAALVVAPRLARSQVLDALSRRIDPVFLPRPLYCVDRLPRDASGKLPRERLLRLWQALRLNPARLKEQEVCA